jgi:hypothetical protein
MLQTCAEQGYPRTQLWSKEQGQTERRRRFADQNRGKISKNQNNIQ